MDVYVYPTSSRDFWKKVDQKVINVLTLKKISFNVYSVELTTLLLHPTSLVECDVSRYMRCATVVGVELTAVHSICLVTNQNNC